MSKSKKSKNATKEKSIINPKRKNNIWVRLILAVFVFVIYGSTVNYQFTLDDDIFYLKHNSVQKGLSAAGEIFSHGSMEKFDGTLGEQPYRPVTLLSFALEKDLFNNDAESAHLINILLYILILQVLLSLVQRLFPVMDFRITAFVVILFAAHPIHTEVVASIKSRDELLAGLFGLLSWLYVIPKNHNTGIPAKANALCIFFFALALFSKESAITLALIIPLSYYMLVSDRIKSITGTMAGLVFVCLLFLLIRFSVIGTSSIPEFTPVHENILLNAKTYGEASATRMVILFHYLKLLFIPWPLSWDYSNNQIPLADWSDILPWLSLLLYSGLAFISIYYWRKKPILSFAILFYIISLTPVSNLFFINFATLGERFLFLPSFGFILALTYILTEKLKTVNEKSKVIQYKTIYIVIGSITLLYSGLSIARSADWKSNLTLFESGVKSSPNSSRAHYSLATEYTRQAGLSKDAMSRIKFTKKAIEHFKISLDIMPDNVMSLYNLGNTNCTIGDTTQAIENYKRAIEINPAYLSALNNLGGVYVKRNQMDSALIYLKQGYHYNKTDVNLMANIASVSYLAAEYLQAIDFANKVLTLDNKNRKSYGVLIDSYNRLGNSQEAVRYKKILDELKKTN